MSSNQTNKIINPMPNMPLKEKLIVGAKQPLSVIDRNPINENSHALRNNMFNSKITTICANFQRSDTPTKANKMTLCDIKLNAKDETNKGALKKSNVVPVVEQFKAFTVYEDNNEHNDGKNMQKRISKDQKNNKLLQTIVSNGLNKENIFRTEIQPQAQNSNDFLGNEFEYSFNDTSMSAKDVMSPMSVDRSISTVCMAKLTDENNAVIVEETANASVELELSRNTQQPRNDRVRFFEVIEYQRDILEYFRESEKKQRPKPSYMRRQSDINSTMRTILVDWLVEVSEEYNLDTETIYLAVSYIDRFLSQMSVVRSKLQLVGTAAMYIASKYEEIYPPEVGEFVFITDDTYSKAQILRMEQIILKIFSFNLSTPTSYAFINTYAVLSNIPDRLKFLALYISELSLLEDAPFLRYLPSLTSAASLALARHLFKHSIWSPELEEITTYNLTDLKEVFLHLSNLHFNYNSTSAQQAIKDKYRRDKYKNVSAVLPVNFTENEFDELVNSYNEQIIAQNQKNNFSDTEKAAKRNSYGHFVC